MNSRPRVFTTRKSSRSLALAPSSTSSPKREGDAMPPVIIFGLTWMLGMLAVTIYLTRFF